METQEKTMLRSFDLARKLKQKLCLSQQYKKIYEIRTVFRQRFLAGLVIFSISVWNRSLSTCFQRQETSTIGLCIFAYVLITLVFVLFCFLYHISFLTTLQLSLGLNMIFPGSKGERKLSSSRQQRRLFKLPATEVNFYVTSSVCQGKCNRILCMEKCVTVNIVN